MNLEWFVYMTRLNQNSFGPYNIFNHSGFFEDMSKHLKSCKTKEAFAIKIRSELMYYFWSKGEHEITICSSPTYIEKSAVDNLIDEREKYMRDNGRYPFVSYVKMLGAEKIDVADQVRLNWDAFVNYVYSQI